MLLSYRKTVTASSTAEGSDPVNAVDEDCRRWWSAGSDQPGEWLCVDLGRDCDVRAVQVNMADEALAVDFPADSYGDDRKTCLPPSAARAFFCWGRRGSPKA